ncbi:single cache domain-containing protein [Pseudoduganella flava]|uniref:Single cache domain-containing protein n=1 Tax=Pseudoduganella flava TaxID=871742 RepID=A0A562Q076_9BURK|nr:cache domain-containing protein [Pseudoduganella flava]QGZ38401.1 hypothetical protein GO485_04605 [Pseudoduganella flava]TWI50054.1 single cache domain-containing protein [Pseudoduganella flava]
MKRLFITLLLGLLCHGAQAWDDGTAAEARALVDRAAALMRDLGPERALAEINNPNGAFHYRDLYVTVYTQRGRIVAHGALPHLVGRNAWDWRDADDQFYVREIVARAQRGETGPVDYTRVHPRSRQLRVKSTWARLAGPYVIACGAFK